MERMLSNLNIGVRLNIMMLAPLALVLVMVFSAVDILGDLSDEASKLYEKQVVPIKDLKVIADDYAVKVIDAVNKANAGRSSAKETLNQIQSARQRISER